MKLAIGQMTSADEYGPNIEVMERLAAEAADCGAQMLCLPEVAGLMNRNAKRAAEQVGPYETDPYFAAARSAAKRHNIWLHAGSSPVAGPGGKFLNRSALITPKGETAAIYDKIHLFDVHLDDKAPIGESKRFSAGEKSVLVETDFGTLGMTICYDLRFPNLYRDLAKAGASLFFIPSAFTVPTGRAHWEVLLRARAIECGAFVVASAQSGSHADGRQTWGHSMVVNPWGSVLLDLRESSPAVSVIEIDLGEVAEARRQIPSLRNNRSFQIETVRGI